MFSNLCQFISRIKMHGPVRRGVKMAMFGYMHLAKIVCVLAEYISGARVFAPASMSRRSFLGTASDMSPMKRQ